MRWIPGILVAMVAGCGSTATDPFPSKIDPGTPAMVVSERDEIPYLIFSSPDGIKFSEKQEMGMELIALNPGDRVECQSDENTPHILTIKPLAEVPMGKDNPGRDHRMVSVLVMEGPGKGRIGTIERYKLRPLPK